MTQRPPAGFSRRSLLAGGAGSAVALCGAAAPVLAQPAKLPNILWLLSDDSNPYIGAYGDPLAHTPNIDALASRGILYRNAYSTAPVCAPSRFGILTGVNAESCSPAQHMRADAKLPSFLRTFPEYLRSAGYYCTNNSKTDYNCDVDPDRIWDESSPKAHWRNRPAGKPFMAMFTTLTSHESRIFKPVPGRVKPEDVRIPATLPDTPAMRQDHASYYNLMEKMDGEIGALLAELEGAGVADDTIVFYYADNGGVLPRSKRFCYDQGLRCPLIVYLPPKWAHLAPVKAGSDVKTPVTFIDLVPTLLSIVGIPKPATMQGTAFLGRDLQPPRKYAFGMRNRMDVRYDFVRTVTDGRYRYIRNYMPHRPHGQFHPFAMLAKGYQDWFRLHDEGKLTPLQERFFQPKPFEELYDLQADADQVQNLVAEPAQRHRITQMRRALDRHMIEIHDNGFIPEGGVTEGYEQSRQSELYPLKAAMALGSAAARRDPRKLALLRTRLADRNEVMRYWAAMGLLMLGAGAAPAASDLLETMRTDPSPQVRIVAAEAAAGLGQGPEAVSFLASLLARDNPAPVRLQAVNALTYVPDAKAALPALRAAAEGQGDAALAAKYLMLVLEGRFDPSVPLLNMDQPRPEFQSAGSGS